MLTITLPVTRASPTSPPSARETGQQLTAPIPDSTFMLGLHLQQCVKNLHLCSGGPPLTQRRNQWQTSDRSSQHQFPCRPARCPQVPPQAETPRGPPSEASMSTACKKPGCLSRKLSPLLVGIYLFLLHFIFTFFFFCYNFLRTFLNFKCCFWILSDIVIPGTNSSAASQTRIPAGESIHVIRGTKGTKPRK